MKREIYRYRVLKDRLPDASDRRIAIITGARQTGKTTLSRYAYPNLPYINLDAPENREAIRKIPAAAWGAGVGASVLDEAQKVPEIFEKVKYAFDGGEIDFAVLTGSSQILLLKQIRESLAGRAFFYELWPLMMCEFDLNIRASMPTAPLIDRLLCRRDIQQCMEAVPPVLMGEQDHDYRKSENHLLTWGGMPALLPLSEEHRWKWLKDYGHTYLERDLGDLARLDDLSPFRKFQKLAALRSAQLLNYSELARDAGVSVDSARRYLEYLRISYQVFLLQPFHENLTSSVVKTPKLYWSDVGILRRMTGFRGELSGELYETMVVSELMKWVRTRETDAEITFYRTRSGLEVDLLIRTQEGILGMEIKSRPRIVAKDFRPLKAIADQLKTRWRGGIVVYTGDEIKPVGDPNIWAVPSRRLFMPGVPVRNPD